MSWIVEQKEVHMTIGSFAEVRPDHSEILNDVQMVKVALLYADHSTLVSLPAFALIDLCTPHDMSTSDPIAYLNNTVLWATDEEKKKRLIQMLQTFERARKRRYSKRGREQLRQLNQWFASHLQKLQDTAAHLKSEPTGRDLFDAMNSGLLDIHAFKSFFDRATQETLTGETVAMDFITTISAAASDTQTYPLFDEDTSGMIISGVQVGDITPSASGINRSKEVGLAADLLARLPVFEHATVKEILDIRRELEKPLRKFRSAMIKFSNEIESASWDKDFAQDADQVFRSEVEPSVLALEDEEKSNSFLNKLTAKVAEKSIQIGGAATASAAISALAVRMLNLPLADVAAHLLSCQAVSPMALTKTGKSSSKRLKATASSFITRQGLCWRVVVLNMTTASDHEINLRA